DDIFCLHAAQDAGYRALAELPFHSSYAAQDLTRDQMLFVAQSARSTGAGGANGLRRGFLDVRGLRRRLELRRRLPAALPRRFLPEALLNRRRLTPFQFRLAVGAAAICGSLAVAEIAQDELAQASFVIG